MLFRLEDLWQRKFSILPFFRHFLAVFWGFSRRKRNWQSQIGDFDTYVKEGCLMHLLTGWEGGTGFTEVGDFSMSKSLFLVFYCLFWYIVLGKVLVSFKIMWVVYDILCGYLRVFNGSGRAIGIWLWEENLFGRLISMIFFLYFGGKIFYIL